MHNELTLIIKALTDKGYNLRAISNTVGAPKATLNRILQGEVINVDYCVKARLLFLHHHHNGAAHYV